MTLQLQSVPVPMGAGLDEGTDRWLVQPPKLSSLVNGWFDKKGVIKKRFDHTLESTVPTTESIIFKHGRDRIATASPHDGVRMVALDDSGRDFQTNESSFRISNLTTRSSVRGTDHKSVNFSQTTAGVYKWDTAYFGDFGCTIWTTDDPDDEASKLLCYVQVESLSSGELVLEPTLVTSIVGHPRVVALSNRYFLLMGSSTSGGLHDLVFATIDTAALGSIGTSITSAVATDGGAGTAPTGTYFAADIHSHPAQSLAYLVIQSGTVYNVWSINSSAATIATTGAQATPSGTGSELVSIHHALVGSRIMLGIASSAGVHAIAWNTGLTAGTAASLVFSTPFAATSPSGPVVIAESDQSGVNAAYIADFKSPSGKPGGPGASGSFNGTTMAWRQVNQSTAIPTGVTNWCANLQVTAQPQFDTLVDRLLIPAKLSYHYSKGHGAAAGVAGPVAPSNYGELTQPTYETFSCGYVVSFAPTPNDTSVEKLCVHARFGVDKLSGRQSTAGEDTFTAALMQRQTGSFIDAGRDLHVGYTVNLGVFTGNHGVDHFQMSFDPDDGDIRVRAHGNTAHLSGGCQGIFDGHLGAENSSHTRPKVADACVGPDAAITGWDIEWLTPEEAKQGTWQLKLVLKWIDHNGDVHRSAPSDPYYFFGYIPTTTPGTFLRFWYYLPPECTGPFVEHNTEWAMEAYIGNLDVDGDNTYHVATWNPRENAAGDSWGYRDGSLTQPPMPAPLPGVGYPDNRPLYTDGGELSSDTTPGAIDTCITESRMFFASCDDPRALWYSKPLLQGYAPEFNASLYLRLESEASGIVAVEQLDEKLVIFTEDSIYYMTGEGPDALGSGSFGGPYLVSGANTGCSDKRSVVSGNFGILFLGKRGWYVLGRDLSVSYIGGPVETQMGILDGNTTISSTIVVSEDLQVRIAFSPYQVGESTISTTLVWHYEINEWALWDHSGNGACLSGGKYYVLRAAAGEVESEARNIYGTYLLSYETAWISFDGVLGYQAVWLIKALFRYFSGDIRVRLQYDYQNAPVTDYEWLEADAAGMTALEVVPEYQWVKSIRIGFSEFIDDPNNPPAAGAAFEIPALRFNFGVLRGGYQKHPTNWRK